MENSIRESIVTELKRAYAGELETVQNYLANSVDLDGVRAEEIKKALSADVQEELGHATMIAKRIKVLGGRRRSGLPNPRINAAVPAGITRWDFTSLRFPEQCCRDSTQRRSFFMPTK
jgi:bacterioferritin (cytochrome b1)